MKADLVLFGGTANARLAAEVARTLEIDLGARDVSRFPDGELSVRLLQSVRRREVVVLQPTAPPTNEHLVELIAFVDACRRAASARITAVVPYFGYARSDRRDEGRVPVMAGVVATLLQGVGVDQVITVDLHTPQIEGFFRIPVDVLSAVPVLCARLAGELPEGTVVVSPDAGRVKLATEYAQHLRLPLAVLHKQRESSTRTKVVQLVGDVQDRCCLLVDDMISTGGTLVESARALGEAGARSYVVAATHGLLIGDAADRLRDAGLSRVLVTDTVAVVERPGVEVVSIAGLLADSLRGLGSPHGAP